MSIELVSELSPLLGPSELHLAGGFSSEAYSAGVVDMLHSKNSDVLTARYHGELDRGSVITQMKRADVFVQMSASEGFSNSLLEALASGLFIIVSEGCGFQPPEGYGVIVYQHTSVAEVHEAIQNRRSKSEISSFAHEEFGKKVCIKKYESELSHANLIT